jgi:hypothetical protein
MFYHSRETSNVSRIYTSSKNSCLNDRYEPIVEIVKVPGNPRAVIGNKGSCRFCGGSGDDVTSRKEAHTVPEGLGNKLIFSADECDGCNLKFSLYESSLVAAVSCLNALGNISGKTGKSSQVGRTSGQSVLSRRKSGALSFDVNADEWGNSSALDRDQASWSATFQ